MKNEFLLMALITSLSLTLISGCTIQPGNAPGNVPASGLTATPFATISPGTNTNSPVPITTSENEITVGKAEFLQILALEKNMARLPGVVINVSSTYEGWPKERLIDGAIDTSWFTKSGDAANLGKSPFVEIVFPQPVNVQGINFRGNREFDDGYDILEGILSLTDKTGKNYIYTVRFPQPDRDFNVKFKNLINGIVSIKLTFTKDESVEPGFSEIEVDGSK